MWLPHDDAHPTRPHYLDDASQVRRSRRHARLYLQETRKLQPKAAGEIGPAIVIGDDRQALERRQSFLPFADFLGKTRQKGLPVGLVGLGVIGVDARQSRQNVGGNELGVFRVKPVMRITAAMRVTIARSKADAAHLQCRDSVRRVDIGWASPLDVGLCGCLQQAVEPKVVIKSNTHDQPCIL